MRLTSSVKALLSSVVITLSVSGCSPHPGAGDWQAEGDNAQGIKRLSVDYEGRAEFSITAPEEADLRCFWSATGEQLLAFQCTPSTDPETEQTYTFSVGLNGIGELSRDGDVIGRFNKKGGFIDYQR